MRSISILGPVIELCLLDTFEDKVDYVSISKYAYDDAFHAKVTKDEEHKRMQDDIDNIVNWAHSWGFVLNADKCRVLQFGGKYQYDFFMNGEAVKKKHLLRTLELKLMIN